MKGLVFTEFLEMAEDTFSAEVVEQVLDMSDLPSGGVYTAVGTYSHEELTVIVGNLAQVTGVPEHDLTQALGRHLFTQFTARFPQFLEGHTSMIDFVPKVESYIHLEVRKLYPDAELPSVGCEILSPDSMRLTYRSSRRLADLADGLLQGGMDHFGEDFSITRSPDAQDPDTEFFLLVRRAGDG